MKTYMQTLWLMLLVAAAMFLVQCQTSMHDVNPDGVAPMTANDSDLIPITSVDLGPYRITFVSAVQDWENNRTVFTYHIRYIDTDPRRGGLSHWVIGLGDCLSFSNVIGASITDSDGVTVNWLSKVAGSEGSGTGCNTYGNILKFDDLDSDKFKDGKVHTFTFTVNQVVSTSLTTNWSKTGRGCDEGGITGPGCYIIKGKLLQKDCDETIAVGSQEVMLHDGSTVTSNDIGEFAFNNVAAGDYTLSVFGQEFKVTLPPSVDLGEIINDISENCEEPSEGCSFSQGYWFAKPNVVWPGDETVTIGGHTYTKAEGRAIFDARTDNGQFGTADAKRAFLQLATIYLSMQNGNLSGVPAALQTQAATIETYLSSVGKLTVTTVNRPNGNSYLQLKSLPKTPQSTAAGQAAGAIGDWIDANHCPE